MHWQMKIVYGEECGGISTGWCWAACVYVRKPEQVSMNLSEKIGVEAPDLQLMPLM
jgi:hypothetical protein